MLKIGEFSKLSHITIKALRFYEKEGLLVPVFIDEWTGYRMYETFQLEQAAKIKAYRQLDLSIQEIKEILACHDARSILEHKAASLQSLKAEIDTRISIIRHLLEEKEMKYQVIVKEIPSAIVYYAETTLKNYGELMQFIPMVGQSCLALNPALQCTEPHYEFCEYLDEKHMESNIHVRHNEAVKSFGKESDLIKFKEIPTTKVLSIYHKGAYEQFGEAYAYIMKYAEENGYEVNGLARECYIDGIWNKASEDEWLTEIQLPIK